VNLAGFDYFIRLYFFTAFIIIIIAVVVIYIGSVLILRPLHPALPILIHAGL
jgi:hypothetical protein